MQIDVDHLYCMYLARREDPCVERGIVYQVIKKFVDVFQVRYVVVSKLRDSTLLSRHLGSFLLCVYRC